MSELGADVPRQRWTSRRVLMRAVLGMKFGCTTAPSRVSAVALTISSSQLTASFFVFLVDQDFEEA